MQSSAACHLFPPQTELCGEFGTCVMISNATSPYCSCEEGYSSLGDFSLDVRNACDIHLKAIIALWALVVCSIVFCLACGLWGIYMRKQAGLMQWRAWRLWIVPYLVILQSILLLAACVMKFHGSETYILGGEVATSLLHAVCCMLCVTCFSCALGGISHLTGESDIRAKSNSSVGDDNARRIFRIDLSIGLCWCVSVIFAFIPMISVSNKEMVWIGAGLHGGWFAIVFLVFSQYAAPHTLSLLLAQMQDSINNPLLKRTEQSTNKLKRVVLKLQFAKHFFQVVLPILALGTVLVTCWPFLLAKTAYLLPMFWFAMEFLLGGAVWVTTTTSSSMSLKRASLALVRSLRSGTRRSLTSVGFDGLPVRSIASRASVGDLQF